MCSRKVGVERVLWTTLLEQRQSWARMNEMITAAAKKHPEMIVLDWNGRARGKDAWLQPDGIHLTPTGAQSLATMINEALVTLGVASRPQAPARQLSIAAKTLPKGHVGRAYATRLQARGGTVPYRWARVGGALAPGLRLTTAGVVTGKPSRVGRYRFVARVVDRTGAARTGDVRARRHPVAHRRDAGGVAWTRTTADRSRTARRGRRRPGERRLPRIGFRVVQRMLLALVLLLLLDAAVAVLARVLLALRCGHGSSARGGLAGFEASSRPPRG